MMDSAADALMPDPEASNLRVVRGIITNVNYFDDRDPSMTFNVEVRSGPLTGELLEVPMLQAGFGDPESDATAPTGIVYVPQVGSRVLVMQDRAGWVILGFLTGPVQTSDAPDRDLRAKSFNPGIEQSVSKAMRVLPTTKIPWIFGLQSGDALIGKGDSRVKVCDAGAVIASNPFCMTVYKVDGEVLSKYSTHEIREIGFLQRHRHFEGTGAEAYFALPASAGFPPQNGAVVTHTIHEATPYAAARIPFLMEQRGHVSPSLKPHARQVVEQEFDPLEVLRGVNTFFTMARDLVAQQLTPTPYLSDGNELDKSHAVFYERTVDSNGSWKLRCGNTARVVGSSAPLDAEFSYDAPTNTYTVVMGPSGSAAVTVSINGVSGEVKVESRVKQTLQVGPSTLELTPAGVSIAGPAIKLQGQVAIEGPVNINGVVQATGDVQAGAISLLAHKHFYTWTSSGGSAPTTPPLP